MNDNDPNNDPNFDDRITDEMMAHYSAQLNRFYDDVFSTHVPIQAPIHTEENYYQEDWNHYLEEEQRKHDESPEEIAYRMSLLDIQALTLSEMLALELPLREDILSPILQTQSLNMIFAKRGVGKTHIALAIAYAIAGGGQFLKWHAPKPRKVLYIDGEMPAATIQKRLNDIIRHTSYTIEDDHLVFINPDVNQEIGIPDLSTEDGQYKLEPLIAKADVIILDNLSTLSRTGNENESDSWSSLQGWALRLRSRGKSVIFIHHAGKGGQQRGTSRREDVLDTVIELRHPSDYNPDQGARFEVKFTKARNLCGDHAKPFEVKLENGQWSFYDTEDLNLKRAIALKKDGLTYREIAQELGISLGTVAKWMKSAKD
jgi:hypothetical protein